MHLAIPIVLHIDYHFLQISYYDSMCMHGCSNMQLCTSRRDEGATVGGN